MLAATGRVGNVPIAVRNWLCGNTASVKKIRGPVAQRLEQQTHNLLVVGSNPTGPTRPIRVSSGQVVKTTIQHLRALQSARMAQSHMERVFSRMHARNSWGNPESRSGPGSTVARTERLRPELSLLLKEVKVRSVLDVPCGDFNWMRFTQLPSIEYLGADVVPDLVRGNSLRYAGPGRTFVQINMLTGPLPRADLVLCRDGLVHFSFSDIARALRTIKKSGSTYLLVTTFCSYKRNRDAPTGSWCPLNLEIAPFFFPPALRVLSDAPLPDGTYRDKSLALYRVPDLPDELAYSKIAAGWERTRRRISAVVGRAAAAVRQA